MVAMGDAKYLLMFTYLNFCKWEDLGIVQGTKGNINSVFVVSYETCSFCDVINLHISLMMHSRTSKKNISVSVMPYETYSFSALCDKFSN